MSEVNITSDLTPTGTTVTVDGKKPKGEITDIYFSMYSITPCCQPGDSSEVEPIPCISLSYNVREELEDGTCKTTNFRIEKRGGEEMVEDSKDVSIKPNQVLDFLVKKMQGKI